MFRNVCRLCLGNEGLVWIFSGKVTNNMADIIHATSGVEIRKTDPVSQMVCTTCCQITIKMFKFRTTAMKNDKDLKAQWTSYNLSKLTSSITIAKKEEVSDEEKKEIQTTVPPPISLKYRHAHPSIKEIIKKYPSIQLPESCLNSHVGAYITVLSNEVYEWFKEKKFSDEEIAILKKEATEVPRKRKRTTRRLFGSRPRRLKQKVPTTEKSTKPNSLLRSLLVSDSPQKETPQREEITLKSLLATQKFERVKKSVTEDAYASVPRPSLKKETPELDDFFVISDSDDDVMDVTDTNMPNMSFVSLAKKTHTLYTCKVCDSQHSTVKELEYHMRRTHTKCPFCSKRFRTLALRDQHVRNSCGINSTPVNLKEVKLELMRVDEDPEIRKKYAYAFEELDQVEKVSILCGEETERAVLEIEKFFSYGELMPHFKKEKETKRGNVICISDEESESKQIREAPKPKDLESNQVRVVDEDVLKAVLVNYTKVRNDSGVSRNGIMDGDSGKEKMLKNLGKHLHQNIPVEMKYSPVLSVDYGSVKETSPRHRMEPQDLVDVPSQDRTVQDNGVSTKDHMLGSDGPSVTDPAHSDSNFLPMPDETHDIELNVPDTEKSSESRI